MIRWKEGKFFLVFEEKEMVGKGKLIIRETVKWWKLLIYLCKEKIRLKILKTDLFLLYHFDTFLSYSLFITVRGLFQLIFLLLSPTQHRFFTYAYKLPDVSVFILFPLKIKAIVKLYPPFYLIRTWFTLYHLQQSETTTKANVFQFWTKHECRGSLSVNRNKILKVVNFYTSS